MFSYRQWLVVQWGFCEGVCSTLAGFGPPQSACGVWGGHPCLTCSLIARGAIFWLTFRCLQRHHKRRIIPCSSAWQNTRLICQMRERRRESIGLARNRATKIGRRPELGSCLSRWRMGWCPIQLRSVLPADCVPPYYAASTAPRSTPACATPDTSAAPATANNTPMSISTEGSTGPTVLLSASPCISVLRILLSAVSHPNRLV